MNVVEYLRFLAVTPYNGSLRMTSTLKNYRSAIAAVHKGFTDGSTVTNNGIITAYLRGHFVESARVKELSPMWDLPLVLVGLTKPPFEPMSEVSIHLVTIKTVFLLQMASGRRGSFIHALRMDPGFLRDENGGIRLKSDLRLDKNQTAEYTPSPVFISDLREISRDDRLFCPVRAIRWYLKRTESIRGDTKHLFLRTTAPYSRAKQATIAGWVKKAISMVYKSAQPADLQFVKFKSHDTRALAATWAHLAGLSVPEIMDAAGWKVPLTFIQHYLRDVRTKGRFSQAVILSAAANK